MVRHKKLALVMLRHAFFVSLLPILAAQTASPDGEDLYNKRCGTCHDGKPQPRMPSHQELTARTPESIYQAMFGGVMDWQATGLSSEEGRAIARFVVKPRRSNAPIAWA